MANKAENIYIDSNVLINYCTGRGVGRDGLSYLFSKVKKDRLFTSSLAIVQTIAQLQKGGYDSKTKKRRVAFSRELTVSLIKKMLSKVTVIDFTFKDLETGMAIPNKDLEDNIQYVVRQTKNCKYLITNNKKDFEFFKVLTKIEPYPHYLKECI